MEIPLLKEIVIILGLSVFVILIFQRFKLPSIIGFLVTGVIIGPKALGLVHASHEVELLSEIGVILLLFVIGIEFSLKSILSIKKTVFVGGGLQVLLSTVGIMLASQLFGLTWNEGVFMGFLFALSSTAIVLNLLQTSGKIKSPEGRSSVAILIFQDIIVVPMMLATPILAGQTEDVGGTVIWLILKVAAVVALMIVMGKYIVPLLFKKVVSTRNKELFLITVVVICFGTAFITSLAGLSLALGAFFAGLVISESDYSHQATANVLPFRELFISFFFVSVGMLLDLNFFFEHIGMILLLTSGAVVINFLATFIALIAVRNTPKVAISTALFLFQLGEFGFILSTVGLLNGILSQEIYQFFLATAILSMAMTPFVFKLVPKISNILYKTPLPQKFKNRFNNGVPNPTIEVESNMHDHLIIIGYGINGKNLSRVASKANIPYVIIEFNAETVTAAKNEGENIIFGDAAQDVILEHARVHEARVIVIAISDAESTKAIVSQIRTHNKSAHIIVRTRYTKEIEENLKLGADEVIPEEFETSIQIFSKALAKYLVPQQQIQAFIQQVRSHNYGMLSNPGSLNSHTSPVELDIPDMVISSFQIEDEDAKILGRTLAQCEFRQKFDITVLAIKRGEEIITANLPNHVIELNDILYVFGNPEALAGMSNYFKS